MGRLDRDRANRFLHFALGGWGSGKEDGDFYLTHLQEALAQRTGPM